MCFKMMHDDRLFAMPRRRVREDRCGSGRRNGDDEGTDRKFSIGPGSTDDQRLSNLQPLPGVALGLLRNSRGGIRRSLKSALCQAAACICTDTRTTATAPTGSTAARGEPQRVQSL